MEQGRRDGTYGPIGRRRRREMRAEEVLEDDEELAAQEAERLELAARRLRWADRLAAEHDEASQREALAAEEARAGQEERDLLPPEHRAWREFRDEQLINRAGRFTDPHRFIQPRTAEQVRGATQLV